MALEYEKPLEVVLGMTLRRTPLEATGAYRERLNAMIGCTYSITTIFPGEVFMKNVDEIRTKVEGVIRLPKMSVTPSTFEALLPGK